MTAFRALTWVEVKLFTREPLNLVFVLVLPVVVLYILNGVFGNTPDPTVWEGISPVAFYTPAYVALVAATTGVLSLPVHLAGYREQGVLRRFRASAVAPGTLIGSHMMVAALIAGVGGVLLTAVSVLAYDGPLPRDWAGTALAYLLVLAAFAGLGGLLGLVMPTARAAQGIGVLLFFVFMMLGGAGPPREVLPSTMSAVAEAVPVTHAGALLRGPWLDRGWDVGALLFVAGLLAGSLMVTAALLARRR